MNPKEVKEKGEKKYADNRIKDKADEEKKI